MFCTLTSTISKKWGERAVNKCEYLKCKYLKYLHLKVLYFEIFSFSFVLSIFYTIQIPPVHVKCCCGEHGHGLHEAAYFLIKVERAQVVFEQLRRALENFVERICVEIKNKTITLCEGGVLSDCEKEIENKRVLSDCEQRRIVEYLRAKQIHVNIRNFPRPKIALCELYDIDANGLLAQTEVKVVSSTNIYPERLVCKYKCTKCDTEQRVDQWFRHCAPTMCVKDGCDGKKFECLNNSPENEIGDFQELVVVDLHEDRGNIPKEYNVVIRGSLCDEEKFRVGAKLSLTGYAAKVPRQCQIKEGHQFATASITLYKERKCVKVGQAFSSVFYAETAVPVNEEFEHSKEANLQSEDEIKVKLDNLRTKSLKEKVDALLSAFLPQWYVNEHTKYAKLALMLQLVGGVEKDTKRSTMHVCIVGELATNKTWILANYAKMIPGSIYTSAVTASDAGLTGSCIIDPCTNKKTVAPGAVVLTDERSACCIDDFHKTPEKDVTALHEALEQGRVTITKCGIEVTLKVNGSVVVALSPPKGEFDPKAGVIANCSPMEVPLFSRFGLVFLLPDCAQDDADYVTHQTEYHYARVSTGV